jgi:hypothetical protein
MSNFDMRDLCLRISQVGVDNVGGYEAKKGRNVDSLHKYIIRDRVDIEENPFRKRESK